MYTFRERGEILPHGRFLEHVVDVGDVDGSSMYLGRHRGWTRHCPRAAVTFAFVGSVACEFGRLDTLGGTAIANRELGGRGRMGPGTLDDMVSLPLAVVAEGLGGATWMPAAGGVEGSEVPEFWTTIPGIVGISRLVLLYVRGLFSSEN